jgi:hypothetical protein
MLRSIAVDIDDGLSEGLRGLLRQIVSNTARDSLVCILAGKFLGIGTGIQVWSAIGIPFEGDGRHGDDRTLRKPLFQIVIFAASHGASTASANRGAASASHSASAAHSSSAAKARASEGSGC